MCQAAASDATGGEESKRNSRYVEVNVLLRMLGSHHQLPELLISGLSDLDL